MDQNRKEFLTTNSIGSFALGSWDRVPRRKYHGLWISRALNSETPDHLLLDVLETIQGESSYPLANYDFGQGAGSEARALISKFDPFPNPLWTYTLNNGSPSTLKRSIHLIHDGVEIHYHWSGTQELNLILAPLFTIREVHALTKEDLALDGTIRKNAEFFEFQPYADMPPIQFSFKPLNASIRDEVDGVWYKNFFYEEEAARGYPAHEDAFCPAQFTVTLPPNSEQIFQISFSSRKASLKKKLPSKLNPKKFESDLASAVSQFVYADARRPQFKSVIAGYPWFSSWARDTFICLPGLSLAEKEILPSLTVLKGWVPYLEAVLFKKAPPHDVNASGLDSPFLWGSALRFLVEQHNPPKYPAEVAELIAHLDQWVSLIFQGECPLLSVTDFGLRCVPGAYASSWMDALVDHTPVTPRHGYPIEINVMFFECIQFLLKWNTNQKAAKTRLFETYLEKVSKTFGPSFWVPERNFIGDGHDGHALDSALRPNHLWAIASDLNLFTRQQKLQSLERVTEELLTPFGLRTLSPKDSRFQGHYQGNQPTRDRCYHQGTVWPWLLGKYTEAALKVWDIEKVRSTVYPVIDSLKTHFYEGPCPGQISEIFDGAHPHHPRGTPAQAWSAAELLKTIWLLRP